MEWEEAATGDSDDNNETMTLLLFNIKELKQRRFWATHVKRK